MDTYSDFQKISETNLKKSDFIVGKNNFIEKYKYYDVLGRIQSHCYIKYDKQSSDYFQTSSVWALL